jgi:hypothetical protein
VDLSRVGDHAADMLMKNVTVTMSCATKCTWVAFLIQEKSMKIDAEQGRMYVEKA